MTTAAFAPSRFGVLGAGERTELGILAPIWKALEDWRTYRRTLQALRALDMRQREDLGIAGLDMKAVARDARR
jgi:uncharacterized protein YjiS (DUF1127 family)